MDMRMNSKRSGSDALTDHSGADVRGGLLAHPTLPTEAPFGRGHMTLLRPSGSAPVFAARSQRFNPFAQEARHE